MRGAPPQRAAACCGQPPPIAAAICRRICRCATRLVQPVVGWIRRGVIDRADGARCASQAVRLVAKQRVELAGLKGYGGAPLVRAACVTGANAAPTPARTISRSVRLSVIRQGCL